MKTKLGIFGVLGAGQLSLMLVEAAKKMGGRTRVFASSQDEPACGQADEICLGSLQETDKIEAFMRDLKVAAYESDFLNFEILNELDSKVLCPALKTIERVSSKIFQRELFDRLGIPQPRFFLMSQFSELSTARDKLGENIVLKWDRGGYDGKGVLIDALRSNRVKEFCEEAVARGFKIFAEELVNFKNEVSLICTLSASGEWDAYPVVFSRQKKGICRFVWGPASKFGLSEELEMAARSAGEKLGKHLGLVGVYALEMFETRDGNFLVNELAPRVHNTGHFSLSTCRISQFENHWRMLLGMKPEGHTSEQNFLMFNILGDKSGPVSRLPEPKLSEFFKNPKINFDFKWYQKKEMRVGRKMGHINFMGVQPSELDSLQTECEVWEKSWLEKF